MCRLARTTGCSARVSRIGTLSLVGLPLEILPSHRDDTFSRSIQTPMLSSRYLNAGCRRSRNQVTLLLCPGIVVPPGFDIF